MLVKWSQFRVDVIAEKIKCKKNIFKKLLIFARWRKNPKSEITLEMSGCSGKPSVTFFKICDHPNLIWYFCISLLYLSKLKFSQISY